MDEDTIKAIARQVAELLLRGVTPIVDKPLYTATEAATFLGVKKSYIYELVRENKIPYARSRGGKLLYLKRKDLIAWATAMPVPSPKFEEAVGGVAWPAGRRGGRRPARDGTA